MLCVLFLSPVKLKSSLVCCGEKILIRISSIAETEIKRDLGAAPMSKFKLFVETNPIIAIIYKLGL